MRIKLNKDEIRDTVGDIKYDLSSLINVLSMVQVHFRVGYRNLPRDIHGLVDMVAGDIQVLRKDLSDYLDDADTIVERLITELDEEESDPDADPWDSMTNLEIREELHGQAADHHYESARDEELEE